MNKGLERVQGLRHFPAMQLVQTPKLHLWSQKHHQGRSLNTKPGEMPEHRRLMWPQNKHIEGKSNVLIG